MRRLVLFALVFVPALSIGCTERTGGTRDTGPGGGDGGGSSIDTGTMEPVDAQAGDECIESARWIYLVDSGNAFLRYEPDTNTITRIGTLSCPATGTPFSMAVDRQATAYVLFQDHRLYQVSTADASCTTTPYVPNQMGFELFGM